MQCNYIHAVRDYILLCRYKVWLRHVFNNAECRGRHSLQWGCCRGGSRDAKLVLWSMPSNGRGNPAPTLFSGAASGSPTGNSLASLWGGRWHTKCDGGREFYLICRRHRNGQLSTTNFQLMISARIHKGTSFASQPLPYIITRTSNARPYMTCAFAGRWQAPSPTGIVLNAEKILHFVQNDKGSSEWLE